MAPIEAATHDVGAGRRVVFYSHDTVGLGHIRRNLVLAGALVDAEPDTDVLLLTGNPEAASLPRPARCDIITLPTITKDADGSYRSRTLGASLEQVVAVRSALIQAAVTAFEPDLLVVDKVPLGVGNELVATLVALRAAQARTVVVLGLREILDDPVTAVRDWTLAHGTQAVESFYDAVWVYGDQNVYDPVAEYGLPDAVAEKVVHTGYLAEGRGTGLQMPAGAADLAAAPPQRPYVLCMVGGGQDGFELAYAFARTELPVGHTGVVVCGPYMPSDQRALVHRAAVDRADLEVHDFVPQMEPFLAGAAAVVSMAGYNSVCEAVASRRPCLLVPRTRPRVEQRIRAERLADLGVVDMIAVEDLVCDGSGSGVDRLASWLADAVRDLGGTDRRIIDTAGLRRIPALTAQMIDRGAERATHAA